eukprot:CAMPEP_0171300526 /NCGR_PEP_ID=MMETSP0816-20121228/9335_1 /TAXON_ID=420281 /ORGANISM="Proboscia inermis, Strain CCAP1064/1" /LENGTH=191 /DNA_ID=CAMNT_0011777063 /DNA_START=125 /DNA_END=697 /DNA_ORIENTATION=+
MKQPGEEKQGSVDRPGDPPEEKSEWSWDPEKRTIINPFSRELDELEGVDDDYNFSVAFGEAVATAAATAAGVAITSQMTLSKMNLVLTGQDTDSVSTLGNPLSPRQLQRQGASMIYNPSPTGVVPQLPTPTSASAVSGGTLDSRISQIEEQLSVMEINIKKNMDATLESLFLKFGANLQTNQPPAGASGGG